MADVVKIGTNVNDGTGDDLRTAFQKVNTKFAELDARGGESNTGTNLGGDSATPLTSSGAAVFKQKSGTELQFRRIKSADPSSLSVTVVGDSIVLNNTQVDTPAIRGVQVGPTTISASTGNYTFGFVGGQNITASVSGRDIVIDGAFNLADDTTPELAGTLQMNSANIIGPGNITAITKLEVVGDSANKSEIGHLIINDSFRVESTSTFVDDVTVTADVTVGGTITGDVTGDLTGNVIGGAGSNFNLGGYDFTGEGRIQLKVPGSGDLIGPEPFNFQTTSGNRTVAFRAVGVPTSESNPFIEVISHAGEAYQQGYGTGLTFSIGSGTFDSEITIGNIVGTWMNSTTTAMEIYADPPGGYSKSPQAQFYSNNEIVFLAGDGQIKLSEGKIEAIGSSNNSLTLDANGTGYIDFYGSYQFPRSIGQAGEVLKVGTSGTVLEWGVGGGGASTSAISTITLNNPIRIVTATAHGLTDQQQITITDVNGTTELNGNSYYVDVIDGTTVDLYSDDALSVTVNGTVGFTAYAADGSGFVTGSAGGGSGTFVGLSDTPTSYAGGAGDADKMIQVNATGNGLEFTAITDIVNSSYINTQGGLLKAGGAMTGTLTTVNVVPTSNNNFDIGTSINKYANIHATTFVGDLTGNVTGDTTGTHNGAVVGNVTGNLTGNVTASSGSSSFNNLVINGTLTTAGGGTISADVNGNLTGNVAGNLVGSTTGIHNGNVNATSGTSTFNIVNIASASATGNITANSFTGDVSSTGTSAFNNITASGNISNPVGDVSINDNASVTGTLTVSGQTTINNKLDVNGQIDLGELRIDSNNIENQTSNGTIRIATNGTGYLEVEGDTRLNGKVHFSTINEVIVGTTGNPSTISANTTTSFITTSDWTAPSAGLANATLPDGTDDGQLKIIKMKNRGRYSLDGISFFERYLQLSLKLNGATTQYDFCSGTNDETGCVTLIWYSGSWWIVSEFVQS